ncbi:type IVB secretion system protein IcmH/DotU [Paracoccus sulfuroxidans]|uniref:Type VI secretion system protein ImpK n=1 Tax=Paracoccus sulfuroxidans TaxID=384678 RepID=A0A562NP44_9RHOB|nr:type IVB secretion system protein IcmH/DotU [Paracoccus sulfuroxidans]TWI33791.1 type VI secretion system protein ImpK [Paracoccus sulfuroxidans]
MPADKDDQDKTVFGGPQSGREPAPGQGQGGAYQGWGQPQGGARPQGEDRTVIGGPGGAHGSPFPSPGGAGPSPFGQPPYGQPPYGQPPFGQPHQPPFGQPPFGQTGSLPFGAPPAPPPYGQAPGGYPGTPYGQPGQTPFGQPGGAPSGAGGQTWLGAPPPMDPSRIGRAPGQDQRGFFPDIRQPPQPEQFASAPRIRLEEALRVRELGAASSANPLLAAAATLLILLGRLRTGLVELQVGPLMDHVTREIDRFERNALLAGVNPHEVLVAKYALSGTADDIVQNLPGGDRGNWQQYSMVARFFHKRDSGVGFFQEAEKAMQAPGQNYNLLELMLVCMSLGFEGQFRTIPNGAVELSRIRNAIYESLRRVHPRPDEDISVTWQPVVQDGGRRFSAIPVPAVFGIAALSLVAILATLLTLINRDGAEAAETLRALHRNTPVIQVDRSVQAVPMVVKNPQLERVRSAFAQEISDGIVKVEPKGDFIAIRVGNLQLFDTGSFKVKEGFAALATRIAEVLNTEGGPIAIEGHTDNVPMSGRGRFKNNYELSAARAEAVAEVIKPLLTDAARVQTVGKGEDEPVADNATPDGQSENRRVEILLAREGTYGGAAAEGQPAEAAPQPGAQPETETAN